MKEEVRIESSFMKAVLEIIVVLLPIYIGIYLSEFLGLEAIRISGDTVLLGGWPRLVGLALSSILLYIFSKKNKLSWADLGIRKSHSWLMTIFLGVIISGIVFVSVAFVINPIISLVFPNQVRDMSVFDHLNQNLPNLIIQLVMIWITAAFIEELLWRGFIIEKLLKHDEKPSIAKILMVLVLSSTIFGMAHLYQGPIGMIKTGAVGLVFGGCYFLSKRSLLPLIIAHGLIDTLDMISHYSGN